MACATPVYVTYVLIAEARWLGRILRALPHEAFPLLNLGSSTEHFRTTSHPWIESEIFEPLRALGRQTVHVDLKEALGVDLVCNFTDEAGRDKIKAVGARSILCSNLLEHLPQDPRVSASQILEIADVGTRLLVTAPRQYPLHPDPIDNGYRPSPSELARLFPGQVCEQEEVYCRRMAFYYADYGTRWGRYAARMMAPVVKPRNWLQMVLASPRHASASCALIVLNPAQKSAP